MGNMIVSDNKIRTRLYNLVIDGEIVEEMLSSRMANVFANEYRAEGYAVDKIEVYSVTKGMEIVGDDIPQQVDEKIPAKSLMTPAATNAKIERDRAKQRARNAVIESRRNHASAGVRYTSYGRDKNSTLRAEYLAALRKNGFRVYNRLSDEIWFGFQIDIAKRIFDYINNGGKKSDLDIKFIGSN